MPYCPLHWDIIMVSKIGQWQLFYYAAVRLCPSEHNDFYIINTISNNNSTESLFTTLAQDQNNITIGCEDLWTNSSDVTWDQQNERFGFEALKDECMWCGVLHYSARHDF